MHSNPNVVLPNFFDALVHPEVVLPLIISHLLSDSLWERRKTVVDKLTHLDVPHPSIPRELYAIKRFIDKNFEHLHADKVSEIYGSIWVPGEFLRLGDDGVQRGIDRLRRNLEYLSSNGSEYFAWMLDALDNGQFPNYTYSTYDVIRAHRKFSQNRKSSSNGVVSCLDEISLFCAATLTLPRDVVYNTIILAGPSHYTAIFWDNDRNGFWFPGKRYLFSRETWQEYVRDNFADDGEAAFSSIMCETDRIISSHGSFVFETGMSNVPVEILHETVTDIERLFGFVPSDLRRAMERPIHELPSLPFHDAYVDLLGSSSRADVLANIRTAALEHDEQWAVEVLLAYRSADVLNHERFFEAAMQSPLAREVARGLHTHEEAEAYVEAIPGTASIFNDASRVAMPDETIRLRTGTHRDRELLLHVLKCYVDDRQTSSMT